VRLFQRTTAPFEPTEAALVAARTGRARTSTGASRAGSRLPIHGVGAANYGVTRLPSFGVNASGPLLTNLRVAPRLTIELHLTDAVVDLIGERFDSGDPPTDRCRTPALIASRSSQRDTSRARARVC